MIPSSPVQSYAFKSGNTPGMKAGLQRLLKLTAGAVTLLLDDLWSEQWIDELGTSGLKAYKVINESRVKLVVHETARKIRDNPLIPKTVAIASFIYDTESGEIEFIQEH